MVELGKALVGMFNEDLLYISIGTLVLTQCVKYLLSYTWRVPSTPLIWFVISPAISEPLSYYVWSYNERVPWFVVALLASILANVAFSILLKNVLGKYAPEVYEKLNLPVERRRWEAGPPPNVTDRRRGKIP